MGGVDTPLLIFPTGGSATVSGPLGPASITATSLSASALDSFNSSHRKLTLLEAHQQAQANKGKPPKAAGSKKSKTEKESATKGEGAPGPNVAKKVSLLGPNYRPFDRERDLDRANPSGKSPLELLQAAGGLGGKFSSGGSSRSFL